MYAGEKRKGEKKKFFDDDGDDEELLSDDGLMMFVLRARRALAFASASGLSQYSNKFISSSSLSLPSLSTLLSTPSVTAQSSTTER